MFRIFLENPGAVDKFCKKYRLVLLWQRGQEWKNGGEMARFDTDSGIFVLTAAGRPGIMLTYAGLAPPRRGRACGMNQTAACLAIFGAAV